MAEPAGRQVGRRSRLKILIRRKNVQFFFEFSSFMYYVYAIKSISRNYIDVGLTNNLHVRVSQHNNGENKTTKAYRPFQLIFSEINETRIEARKKEKYLKSGVGKEFLKTLFE